MITKKDIDNAIKGSKEVYFGDIDIKRVPHTKFTKSDRLIMVDILGLKPKKKETVNYFYPNIPACADAKNDYRRTAEDHQLKIRQHEMRVDREFHCLDSSAKRKEISDESIARIDTSGLDDQDMAVLGLINKIIEESDAKRDERQKLSLNRKVREAV